MATKKKILKIALIIIGGGILIAGGIGFYIFNKPARDIQNTETDYSYKASEIVNEYLTDARKANDKYLDEAGNSKVLEISGEVAKISEDFNNQKVLLLKSANDKAGVSCTFTSITNSNILTVKVGDQITIKGVIRSGASYDEDLGMYENVIIEKSDIVSNK
jgi:N-acetylneuraminic acid mutarotase